MLSTKEKKKGKKQFCLSPSLSLHAKKKEKQI